MSIQVIYFDETSSSTPDLITNDLTSKPPTGWGQGGANGRGNSGLNNGDTKGGSPHIPERFDKTLHPDTSRKWTFDRLWATPLYRSVDSQAGKLNPNLTRLMLHLEQTTPSVSKSNFLGWQSTDDQLDRKWTEPGVKELLTSLRN